MRTISQLVLTFLLNSLWQIALIAGLAALGSWLLRNSVARYRHWLWVSALCLGFAVPVITSLRTLGDTASLPPPNPYSVLLTEELQPLPNEGDVGATHVWVNAIDGKVMKTEKELPRKMRSPEQN